MPDKAIGRKEIMKALHIAEWGTVRRWKKAGLPIRHLPNRKPVILFEELHLWMIQYDELKKKQKKEP